MISQVFGEPVPGGALAGHATVLAALQAGIAGQLAVLDDAQPDRHRAVLRGCAGVQGRVLAARLTAHLLRGIVVAGSRGGPLFALASQLNDDVTHPQGRQLEPAAYCLGDLRRRPADLADPRSSPMWRVCKRP